MNEFDKTVEQKLAEAGESLDGDTASAQHLIMRVIALCYEQLPMEEVDDQIYRSKYYGKISLGTSLEIQRRVILRHIDQKS